MRSGYPAAQPPRPFCPAYANTDQVRMARDVAVMFDELKAMADRHAEMHADRARLQAELEQSRAELARAKRRPRRQ
jgi:predicted secreted Zn-dependent protease